MRNQFLKVFSESRNSLGISYLILIWVPRIPKIAFWEHLYTDPVFPFFCSLKTLHLVYFSLSPEHTKPTVGRRAVFFFCRPTKFSQCVPHHRPKLVLVCFFSGNSTCWIGVGACRSVGPSDHPDWLYSWRTSAQERRRTDVLLGRRVCSTLWCNSGWTPPP